jgi:flagellar basal body-associated protein FliL
MTKVLGILNIASKVMMFIVATAVTAISLTTAYIMFAPDEFPKPFRLVYNLTGTPATVAIGATTTVGSGGTGSGEETTPTQPAVEPTPQPGSGVMVNMATKIINLSDPNSRKYIRVTIVLEFEPPSAEEVKKAAKSGGEGGTTLTPEQEMQNKLNALMPMMDDAVISLLSTKTYDELYTADGKEKLRNEVKDAIQERLSEYKLMSVYFTEFVVQ